MPARVAMLWVTETTIRATATGLAAPNLPFPLIGTEAIGNCLVGPGEH